MRAHPTMRMAYYVQYFCAMRYTDAAEHRFRCAANTSDAASIWPTLLHQGATRYGLASPRAYYAFPVYVKVIIGAGADDHA